MISQKFVVEIDQQGIDNFLFAEVPDSEHTLANDDASHSVEFQNILRKRPKKELDTEIDALDMDNDYKNYNMDADAETDVAFDIGASEHTSNDDTMSSASEEMDVKELKPVKKKANKSKPKRTPLPRHLK